MLPKFRFIPTPVGNTPSGPLSRRSAAVYPHTCGEHATPVRPGRLQGGLSPHLWGTQIPYRQATVRLRFIPTPVGNTPRARPLRRSAPVYPHTCGEHVHTPIMRLSRPGLSPHLWGTRVIAVPSEPHFRFIPTPVGNTTRPGPPHNESTVYPHTCGEYGWRRPLARSLSVYPHTCGEHPPRWQSGRLLVGLSPHLWGTL